MNRRKPSSSSDCMPRSSAPLSHPILVGVLPLYNTRHANFLHHEVPGIDIPEEIRERIRKAGDQSAEEGIQIAVEQIEADPHLGTGHLPDAALQPLRAGCRDHRAGQSDRQTDEYKLLHRYKQQGLPIPGGQDQLPAGERRIGPPGPTSACRGFPAPCAHSPHRPSTSRTSDRTRSDHRAPCILHQSCCSPNCR